MLALLRLPRPPLARSSRVPPSPLRPPPARLAALPATVPGWVGPLSGGGGVRVLDLPLPPTGMLAALGLAIRRPSPPSPPFAPDRSLSPPFAARAVLHAFIQSRASGHGLCAPSPLMGIASVTSQITGAPFSSLAATLNKELDECRWVIPQARVRTPAGTLAGTLPHGTFVAASGRRTAARQTGMALARRSLPGMPSAARFSSLWTAGRVSGFGPSTLMSQIPVKHTHTRANFWNYAIGDPQAVCCSACAHVPARACCACRAIARCACPRHPPPSLAFGYPLFSDLSLAPPHICRLPSEGGSRPHAWPLPQLLCRGGWRLRAANAACWRSWPLIPWFRLRPH